MSCVNRYPQQSTKSEHPAVLLSGLIMKLPCVSVEEVVKTPFDSQCSVMACLCSEGCEARLTSYKRRRAGSTDIVDGIFDEVFPA